MDSLGPLLAGATNRLRLDVPKMKHREQLEYLGLAGVQHLVEQQAADRARVAVGELRVLLRVAFLTGRGALVRGTDIQRAGLSHPDAASKCLALLVKKRLLGIMGGGKISGYYLVTSRGQEVCADFANGQRRAVEAFDAFEAVQPYRRLGPKPARKAGRGGGA